MLMLIAYHASAQETPIFDIGVKAGVNISNINNHALTIASEDIEVKYLGEGIRYGFVAGVWGRVRLPVLGLYVQPEVLITQSREKVYNEMHYLSRVTISGLSTQIYTITGLDLVMLFGKRYELGVVDLRLHTGPVYSRVVSSYGSINSDFNDITNGAVVFQDYQLRQLMNKSQFGLQFGVGMNFSRINLDLRYQQNLTNFYDQDASSDFSERSGKLSSLQLTLGYKFF